MTKSPAKASASWARRLTGRIVRAAYTVSLFAWVIVIIVFVYGMLTKASVEVTFNGGFPSIKATPPAGTPPPALVRPVQVPIPDLQGVLHISRLPESLRGKPDDVVDKVNRLWEDYQKACSSVWYCCSVISIELAMKVSIDTTQSCQDDSARQVNRCIQTCLNAIDCYAGQIDGDPARTKQAVETFQRASNLQVDGKVGKATWHAILVALAQKIYGSLPQPLNVALARQEN
jgi:hypothetical protein